jgi:hypothetical protein
MRRNIVALALVTASLGVVGSTLAGSWSSSKKTPAAAAPARRSAPRMIVKQDVFRPPKRAPAVRAARRLPATGFDLQAAVSLGIALVAGGSLLRLLPRS